MGFVGCIHYRLRRRLRGHGSAQVSDDDLTLVADQLPPVEFGYFLTSMDAGLVSGPGGSQGNLCLGGTIGRYNQAVASSGAAGYLLLHLELASMPPPVQAAVQPGDTWRFQCWHRDHNPGSTSNFTDGLEVTFL